MPCIISVAGGIAYRPENSQVIQEFHIHGVAVECTDLTIELSFGDPVQTVQASASVGDMGAWDAIADLSGTGLMCDGASTAIDVVVTCTDNPACTAATKFENYTCQTYDTCPLFEKVEALAVASDSAGCNIYLEREVRLSATLLAPVPNGLPVIAQFCLVNLESGEVTNTAAGEMMPQQPFNATGSVLGGIYRYELKLLSPSPCQGPIGILQVPACPGPEDSPAVCPSVNFESAVVSEDCTASNQRIVTVVAEVIPEPGHPVSATLEVRQEGGLSSSVDFMASTEEATTLSGSLPLSAGEYDLVVNIGAPESCNDASLGFEVPKCPIVIIDDDTPPDEGAGTPPDPDQTGGGGGDIGINWCLILFWVGFAFFIVGAIGTGVGFCLVGLIGAWVNPYWVAVWAVIINVSVILLMLGTLILTIWIFLCGSCRINCQALKFARDLFTMYISPIAGVLAAIGLVGLIGAWSPLCWVGWLIDFIASFWLAALLNFWIGFSGCEPWSNWWPSWLRPTMPDWMRTHCGGDGSAD